MDISDCTVSIPQVVINFTRCPGCLRSYGTDEPSGPEALPQYGPDDWMKLFPGDDSVVALPTACGDCLANADPHEIEAREQKLADQSWLLKATIREACQCYLTTGLAELNAEFAAWQAAD